MAKTSNIFARVEPAVKEQAEDILAQLGVSMSNAINMFLRQVVLQKGVPFEMKLPQHHVVDMNKLSEAEFDTEMEKGMLDLEKGRVIAADDVAEQLKREYNI